MSRLLARSIAFTGIALALAGCYAQVDRTVPVATPAPAPSTVYVAPNPAPAPGTVVVHPAY